MGNHTGNESQLKLVDFITERSLNTTEMNDTGFYSVGWRGMESFFFFLKETWSGSYFWKKNLVAG